MSTCRRWPLQFPQFPQEVEHLTAVFFKSHEHCSVPHWPCSRHFFGDPDPVFTDQKRCGAADTAAAAVIAAEKDPFSVRKVFHEPHHDARVAPSEAIDALVVISHNKKAPPRRKESYDLILFSIDVLEFVHKDRREAPAPVLPRAPVRSEYIAALQDHIVKIHIPVFLQEQAVIPSDVFVLRTPE